MRKKFRDLVAATMSAEARAHADKITRKTLVEMELSELREALQMRQEDLAEKLKVTQATISRLERRPNVLLETISNYVKALGGELELHAVLPHRTVRLTHFLNAKDVGLSGGKKRGSRRRRIAGRRG